MITGGAGFIGSHIVDLLVQRQADVVVLDNYIRGRQENLSHARSVRDIQIVDGDIRDRALLARLMRGVDVVYHQAALRITQCAAEPRQALEVMFDGSFNVLEAAVEAGVKKVIAASSASVYGLATGFPTPETQHPYDNRTLYGAGKLALEGLLRAFNEMYGLPYVAFRYFNAYGPRMDIHGRYTEVMIRWMERIESDQPPIIFGDGTQTMDFIYVEDIARANILAAETPVSDEVFNVASGKETSLKQLAVLLMRLMGKQMDIQYEPERKVNPVPRRLGDPNKAEQMLNFRSETDLEEGLGRLIDWWRREKAQP